MLQKQLLIISKVNWKIQGYKKYYDIFNRNFNLYQGSCNAKHKNVKNDFLLF